LRRTRRGRCPMNIELRTVLRNAFNKETFIFTGPTDDPEVARFDVVLGKE